MASKQQLTGIRGVYLVAAELSKLGFIASPTSRSARGADILATNQSCTRTYAIQVKTNASAFGFWLLNNKASKMVSENLFYVFVNLARDIEYYIGPSKVVANEMYINDDGSWPNFAKANALPYKGKWKLFGNPVM